MLPCLKFPHVLPFVLLICRHSSIRPKLSTRLLPESTSFLNVHINRLTDDLKISPESSRFQKGSPFRIPKVLSAKHVAQTKSASSSPQGKPDSILNVEDPRLQSRPTPETLGPLPDQEPLRKQDFFVEEDSSLARVCSLPVGAATSRILDGRFEYTESNTLASPVGHFEDNCCSVDDESPLVCAQDELESAEDSDAVFDQDSFLRLSSQGVGDLNFVVNFTTSEENTSPKESRVDALQASAAGEGHSPQLRDVGSAATTDSSRLSSRVTLRYVVVNSVEGEANTSAKGTHVDDLPGSRGSSWTNDECALTTDWDRPRDSASRRTSESSSNSDLDLNDFDFLHDSELDELSTSTQRVDSDDFCKI